MSQTGLLDLGRRGMNGAFELWMGVRGLGGDGDVGTVTCRPDGNGQADASAGAGDEEGLAL
jgi:hypothetical protein